MRVLKKLVEKHVGEINEAVRLPWDQREKRLTAIVTSIYKTNAQQAEAACERVRVRLCSTHAGKTEKIRVEGMEAACEMCGEAAKRDIVGLRSKAADS